MRPLAKAYLGGIGQISATTTATPMAMLADASSEKPEKIAPKKEIIANPAAPISQCDSDPMPLPSTRATIAASLA